MSWRSAAAMPPRRSSCKLKGDVGQVGLFNVVDRRRAAAAGLRRRATTRSSICVGILHESGSQRFEAVHHIGPARLARIAREAGVERFVHISAIGADPRSASAYARTKAAGEAAVRDAFPTATILRPSIVFGPEDQFFNRFAAMAMISPVLPLIGGGETRFQPVYVGDVAEAVVRCIDDPATAGRTYELGGPKVYTLRGADRIAARGDPAQAAAGRPPVRGRRDAGAAAVAAAEPAADAGPGRDAETRQHRRRRARSGFEALGIAPTAVEAILPTYLDRFRRGGWYARERAVSIRGFASDDCSIARPVAGRGPDRWEARQWRLIWKIPCISTFPPAGW